ncbi:MAG: methyl-accepting chemotaxis protein [Kineosporiaceae bacterium]
MSPTAHSRPPAPLRPAVAVVTRLRTRSRLFGLVTVLLVPGVLTTAFYWLAVTAPIDFADRELQGTRALRPAVAAMADLVAGRTADLDAVVTAARGSGLDVDDALAPVATAAGAAPPSDAAARAALVADLAGLVAAVGDGSNLILDPDLDSFYVMDAMVVQVPKLLVAAAQAAAPEVSGDQGRRIAAQAVLAGVVSGAGGSVSTDRETASRAPGTVLEGADIADLDGVAEAAASLAEHLTSTLDTPAAAPTDRLVEVASAAEVATASGTAALDSLLHHRITGYQHDRLLALLLSGAGLALAGWFAVAVLWRTNVDVALAVGGVEALADGDLEERPLPSGRDEYGDIGRAVERARLVMHAARDELEQTDRAREEQVQASFVQQATAQAQLRRRAQAVIDETATTVGGQLSEVSSRVHGLQGAASTIDERVSTADAATRSVVARAEEVRAVLGSLGGSLQQVAGMTRVIAGVADQTKLLALNATIEAARAGETGRGFAVVADEVKNLATTTAEATADVARTVSALEADAQATIATIQAMAEGIAEVDSATNVLRSVAVDQRDLVDQLGVTLDHAVARINEMSALTDRLERRHFRRVPLKGTARIDPSDARGVGAQEVDLVNISRGGVLTASRQPCPLDEGSIVLLEFALRGREVKVHASLRRVEAGPQPRIAPEFGHVDPEVVALIDDYVASVDDSEDD